MLMRVGMAKLTPLAPGVITDIRVDVGDRVEEGQILAVINSVEVARAKSAYLSKTAELEARTTVFERAQNVPQSLKDFALKQMEKAVLEGTGPTRDGGALEAGNVNATEARLLRRAMRQLLNSSSRLLCGPRRSRDL